MGGFFSMDGMFYKFGNMLADMMIVGLLWFVCSLPIVTCGASTTAMFYVMTKKQSDKDGYIFRDFFNSFKSNFKLATKAWLTILAVGIIIFINISNIGVLGDKFKYILPFQFLFMIEAAVVSIYIFPILSRFELGYFTLFKTAFFMANRHILTTVICLILFVGAILGCIMMPPFVLICAGVYAFVTSILFMRVFRKYRPEMDKDEYDHEGNIITGQAELAVKEAEAEEQKAEEQKDILQ